MQEGDDRKSQASGEAVGDRAFNFYREPLDNWHDKAAQGGFADPSKPETGKCDAKLCGGDEAVGVINGFLDPTGACVAIGYQRVKRRANGERPKSPNMNS